jgi:alpha-tubulin suppressor-like RCC1 family protein
LTVSNITDATAVATGGYHTCAMLSDGSIQCWGNNSYGQLGNDTTTSSSVPVTVSGITNAVAVAAGYDHTCALLSDGSVQCWGVNGDGQLGNDTTGMCSAASCSAIPVTVSGVTNASGVAAGGSYSCALLSGGSVQCWGNNGDGQLGNGTTTSSYVPVTVSGVTNATAVSASDHTCAVLSGGSVQCWGRNGGLGNGSMTDSTVPVTVTGF